MAANLDSDLLRTFVAIADSGSFTGAAKSVSRTQSAVSMQIKRLEETIGSLKTICSSSGSPAVRVWISDFRLPSTSEPGVIFFFDRRLGAEYVRRLDRQEADPIRSSPD